MSTTRTPTGLVHKMDERNDFDPEAIESRKPEKPLLTRRQRDALVSLAKTGSAKGVADLMGISTFTASSHLKDVYERLNVPNNVRAVVVAFQRGLLSIDGDEL